MFSTAVVYESCSLCVAMYALYGLSWIVIPPEILYVVKIDTTMYDTNEGEAIFVRRRLCCVNPAVKEAIVKGNDSCSKSVLSKGSIPSFCKAYPKHFSASLHSLTHRFAVTTSCQPPALAVKSLSNTTFETAAPTTSNPHQTRHAEI